MRVNKMRVRRGRKVCVDRRGRHGGTRVCGYACACLRSGGWCMYGLVREYARERAGEDDGRVRECARKLVCGKE